MTTAAAVDTYTDKLGDAVHYAKATFMYLFFCVGDNSYDDGDASDSYEAVELTLLREGPSDNRDDEGEQTEDLSSADHFYCEHYVPYGTKVEGSYKARAIMRQEALTQICLTFSLERQVSTAKWTLVELRRGFMAFQKAILLAPRPEMRWTLIKEFEKLKAQYDCENEYDKETARGELLYAEDTIYMPTERLKHYVQAIRYTNDVVEKELVRQEFEKFYDDVENNKY